MRSRSSDRAHARPQNTTLSSFYNKVCGSWSSKTAVASWGFRCVRTSWGRHAVDAAHVASRLWESVCYKHNYALINGKLLISKWENNTNKLNKVLKVGALARDWISCDPELVRWDWNGVKVLIQFLKTADSANEFKIMKERCKNSTERVFHLSIVYFIWMLFRSIISLNIECMNISLTLFLQLTFDILQIVIKVERYHVECRGRCFQQFRVQRNLYAPRCHYQFIAPIIQLCGIPNNPPPPPNAIAFSHLMRAVVRVCVYLGVRVFIVDTIPMRVVCGAYRVTVLPSTPVVLRRCWEGVRVKYSLMSSHMYVYVCKHCVRTTRRTEHPHNARTAALSTSILVQPYRVKV